MVSISASLRRRSSAKSPQPCAGFHGGICRLWVMNLISAARGCGVFIRHQRERRDVAFVMTRLAVLLEDAHDFFAERGRRRPATDAGRRVAAPVPEGPR